MLRLWIACVLVSLVGASACTSKSDEGATSRARSTATSVAAPLPGVRIVYAVDAPEGAAPGALEQVRKTIRARLDAMSLNGNASVQIKGTTIVVDMPGVDQATAERAKITLRRRGRLTFQLVNTADELSKRLHDYVNQDATAKTGGIGADMEQWPHPDTRQPVHDYFLTAPDKTALVAYVSRVGAASKKLAAADDHRFVYELVRPRGPSEPRAYWRTYYVEKAATITGASIAKVSAEVDPRLGTSQVMVHLDEDAKTRFADLTDKNLGRKLAIVIDDEVMTAPLIQTKIPGGVVAISMGTSLRGAARTEASDIAAILRAGSMPVALRLESMTPLTPRTGEPPPKTK